jgi:DnaJ-class molecular chaperone
MRCTRCFGQGVIFVSFGSEQHYEPCSDCDGYGNFHCCDGLVEQPERVSPDVPESGEVACALRR